jgi:23S rRNA (uridine2552-2'-O)-methyltransferase
MELDQKVRLLRPGMLVLDLGAAPGGWSQYVAERISPAGRVVATDRLPMEPTRGVDFVQGDFQEREVLASLRAALAGAKADLVISDMAPNLSGMNAVDQPRAMYLAELALDLAREILRPGGDFLTKLFQGQGFDAYLRELRQNFANVRVNKPKASRSRSREIYALARNLKL